MRIKDKINLPCPFCGGIQLTKVVPIGDEEFSYIECDSCGASGPNYKNNNLGWNSRYFPKSDSRVSEIRVLELLDHYLECTEKLKPIREDDPDFKTRLDLAVSSRNRLTDARIQMLKDKETSQ